MLCLSLRVTDVMSEIVISYRLLLAVGHLKAKKEVKT